MMLSKQKLKESKVGTDREEEDVEKQLQRRRNEEKNRRKFLLN